MKHISEFLSPQEVQDTGLLQEVNRCFFHPLGFALAVCRGDGKADILAIYQVPDPDGYAFSTLDDDEARVKAAAVEAIRARILPARLASCGFDVQPIGHSFPTDEDQS